MPGSKKFLHDEQTLLTWAFTAKIITHVKTKIPQCFYWYNTDVTGSDTDISPSLLTLFLVPKRMNSVLLSFGLNMLILIYSMIDNMTEGVQ